MKRLVLLITTAAFFLFGCTLLSAQQHYATLKGKVINAENGQPIPLANVFLTGTVLGDAADNRGAFEITRITPGHYQLVCTAIGFKKETQSVQVKAGETRTVVFRLHPTAIQFSDLVVTASKHAQRLEEVPVRMDVLSNEEMQRRTVQTLSHALQYLPGVQMAGNNISIRGSSGFSFGLGTRTLVLLDGVPYLSGDESKASFESLPLINISRVEVMKGAGSALYGSNAMGGVINIITRDPEKDSTSFHLWIDSGVYDLPAHRQWRWYHSRRGFRKASFGMNTSALGIHSRFAFSYDTNDHFKQDADFRNWLLFAKFHFASSPNQHWNIQIERFHQDIGGFIFWKDLNHALEPGNEPKDAFTRTITNRFFVSAITTRTVSSRFLYKVRFSLDANRSEDHAVARPGGFPPFVGLFRESKARSFGNELQLVWQPNKHHTFIAGLEGAQHRVHSIQYGRHTLFTGSIYGQYTWQATPVFTMEIGGRWDAELAEEGRGSSQLNPRLGMTYQLSPTGRLRLSVGRGFRAPSIAERYISTTANQINILPNPDLRPESTVSVDLGWTQSWGGRIRTEADLFFTDYWHLIEPELQSSTTPAVKFENVTRARITGIEISQQISLIPKIATLMLAYTGLKTQDLSRWVNGAPNPFYKSELKYRSNHLVTAQFKGEWRWLTYGIDFRYMSKVKRIDRVTNIPDITERIPAYITDLQIGVHRGSFSVQLSLNNAFQYYYLISPGNLGDIRNLVLRLALQM